MRKIALVLSFLFLSCSREWDNPFDPNNDQGINIPTEGLVAYYPFNGNANDESGNGNNGEIFGTTLTNDRFGNDNSAYFFNGNNNYIQIPFSESLDLTKSFTFVAWILPYGWGEGDYGRIFDNDISRIYLTNSGFSSSDNDSFAFNTENTDRIIAPANSLELLKNTLVAVSYDGEYVNFYKDAVLIKLEKLSNIITESTNDFFIGNNRELDRDFNGIIDDVIIYNKALTNEEIELIYENGKPLGKPKLSAHIVDESTIQLTWSKVDNAKNYLLESSKELSGSYTTLYSGSDTTYIHTNLSSDKQYRYRLKAIDGEQQSDWSSLVVSTNNILSEDFEDNIIDNRITITKTGSFNHEPGIKDITNFGSNMAFGFGRSTCGASCFDRYKTSFRIDFGHKVNVAEISFKEMELYGNWGSHGMIYFDGTQYESVTLGGIPSNSNNPDSQYRDVSIQLNRQISTMEIVVRDITRDSEIFIDDLVIVGN